MSHSSLLEQLTAEDVSAVQQYREMFVGEPGLWPLVRYELITSIAGVLPGAAGYFLRGKLIPRLLGRAGRRPLFGRGVVLRCPRRVWLGDRVVLDDAVVLDAKGEGSAIELGDRVLLGRGSILSCNRARIRIGATASIAPFCLFASRSFIDIGENVAIAAGVHINAAGHASDDPELPIIRQAKTSLGVTVEDNVWIGSGARILDGVRIGRNAIVSAGAVVTRDVEPYGVVVGNPARLVRSRKAVAAE
jgi:acetyltransferase-like isoleucine patch superfamily enzyme